MKFSFAPAPKPEHVSVNDWLSFTWQMQNSVETAEAYERIIPLTQTEREGFLSPPTAADRTRPFAIRSSPYYLSLIDPKDPEDPIRRIAIPRLEEYQTDGQHHPDPLGENKNSPVPRIIHRYPDRVLFLVTDMCSVFCRYCTRKHFTGQDQILPNAKEYTNALDYIQKHKGVREVILSGGDPLTMGDGHLERILRDLRAIEHIELIRIGSRMPVVCPMRITPKLVEVISKYHPVYIMAHFNHPRELTQESTNACLLLVNAGIPVMNQMVLLNGVNNHPAIVQALNRRLLYVRVKPYYMFQCDPSRGSEHLRTSLAESLGIQRELWGRLSGLAMPNLSLDIPDGGGKAGLVPNFWDSSVKGAHTFTGWDGVQATYQDPVQQLRMQPSNMGAYLEEWQNLKSARTEVPLKIPIDPPINASRDDPVLNDQSRETTIQ